MADLCIPLARERLRQRLKRSAQLILHTDFNGAVSEPNQGTSPNILRDEAKDGPGHTTGPRS